MFHAKPIIALLGCILLLVPAALAGSEEFGDPIVKFDGSYDVELDLSVMVDDMLPRLLGAVEQEDPEYAENLRALFDLIGVEALQRMTARTKQTRDHTSSKFRITLDPDQSETLLYKLLTTPNGSCDFGRRVSRDEVVMFMTIHNFPYYLDVLLDFMTRPVMSDFLGEVPLNADGDFEMQGFAPRRDLLPLLSGEFDFFFLEPAEGAPVSPMTAPYFLVLGSTDGFALRDRILEILHLLGVDSEGNISGMIQSVEPEMVGDFEMKVLPFGGALAVSQDFLVIGLDPERTRGMLAATSGDLKVPDGIEWVYLDGPKYGAYMESMMGMAGMMSGEDAAETEWMMQLYGILFDHLDYEEVLYRSRKDGMEGEVEMKGPFLTGVYQMLPSLMDRLPEMLAEQKKGKEKQAYHQAIGQMDAAMIAYAEANGGVYPADPTVLVEEGYLADWPFVGPTPAGQYEDWAYTYHRYLAEDGTVIGYIFFLYGGGETNGFDVYTADNVAAEGPFVIDADGVADGVASFCYDGTALEPVQEFLAK